MRLYFFIILLIFLIFTNPPRVFAESSYVLPYPSAMPGSIFYKLNLIQEELLRFWYFGDFGQFKYNLQQSDKYLVEAKTLFDYKQYLLAYRALGNSNAYFERIWTTLISAKKNGKNTVDKEQLLKEAAEKHVEKLVKLKNTLPPTFEWKPEKEKPRILNFHDEFETSIRIRQEAL